MIIRWRRRSQRKKKTIGCAWYVLHLVCCTIATVIKEVIVVVAMLMVMVWEGTGSACSVMYFMQSQLS